MCEALCADVLTGVLNAGQQVGNKLVDGAFVLHRPRDALSHFNLITLTEEEEEEEKREHVGKEHTDPVCY